MFVIFNSSKEFIGYSPDIQPNPTIFTREIPENQRDLLRWKWVGDYDSGRMVENVLDIHKVTEGEDTEEKLVFEEMARRYPLGIQLTYLIKQIYQISKHQPTTIQDPHFMDMAEYILPAIEKRDKRIKYRKSYGEPQRS